ncbi:MULTISPECIES: DUF5134 domain-containing protein [Streptomyces]|uniref:DUF5134 domain-containing protein n=1 Tax=Streptomyces dengpaensis TaxID=2049881 RepID=A0ABM6SMC4_9ACTN|nr:MULTISPECIES: DUF5134 domain-containing protein [Streptomyces]AVH55209.1 DUF5134 domain-containing protein [Streptomyces dengpaensis]PIB07421.1 hypothetical protein B1C81_20105 [Streptomyces sp. HG99]
MSASDAVYCMLTALFTATAVHGLRRGVMSRNTGWRGRGDHLLHTAMALVMAVMPWSWGRSLHHTAQAVFFAAAALWFPLTAVCRHQESRLAATVRRLPYTVGMAAMAWMAWTAHTAGPPAAAEATTAALALYLLTYALWSLIRVMPALRTAPYPAAGPHAGQEPYGHFWDGSMALGTVIMLLMPH